jgi:short-subunit dehydrogenase
VVITGASSGIGAALARHAFALGAKVTLVARRKDLLLALAAESRQPVHVVQADLSGEDEVTSWVAGAEAVLGPIDVLINNAGVQIVGPFTQAPWAEVKQLIAVDLLAPLQLSQHVVRGMLQRGSGTLVDVSSMAALAPTPGMAFYNAAKGGLGGASEGLRAELAPHGVHVVTVYPGPVRTAMEGAAREKFEPSLAMRLFAPSGEADVLARLVFDAVARRRARVIYPRFNAAAWHFRSVVRWLVDRFAPGLVTP